jgi:hypothetical protein
MTIARATAAAAEPITAAQLTIVPASQVFAEAGLTEVSRPSPRRVVMRVDFTR